MTKLTPKKTSDMTYIRRGGTLSCPVVFVKGQNMITMKDWLLWRRKGLNLFSLDNMLSIFATQERTLEEFERDLTMFFCGPDGVKNDKNKNGGDDEEVLKTKIPESVVWNVVSLVPGWQDMTWNECVRYSNAVIDRQLTEQSILLCAIHNAHVSRKKDLKRPDDFNPIRIREHQEMIKRIREEAGVNGEQRLEAFLRRDENKGEE